MRVQIGDRVFIIGNHPWKGHWGVISEKLITPVGEMWRVDLDNGRTAGVTDKNLRKAS